MRIKSFVIIEKDDSYLLIKEAAEKWNEKWFFPGGSLKPGETAQQAAIRETFEEAGCNIILKGIGYIRYYPNFFNKRICVFYSADMVGDTIKQIADKHSLAVKWFKYDELCKLPLRQKMLEVIDTYKVSKSLMPIDALKIYPNKLF